MKRNGLLLIVLCAGMVPARAQSTSAQFLELGGGARYSAMGEAAVAVADDANAIYWNPAGLARVKTGSLSFLYGAYVESIRHQNAVLASPVKAWGTFALSAQSLSVESIRQTDDLGRESGSSSPSENAFAAGWGRTVGKNGAAGLSAKYVESKILHTASTWAMDAGLGWTLGKLETGVSVRNLGGKLTYDKKAEPLPLSAHLGAALRLGRAWLISVEGARDRDAQITAAAGTEVRWKFSQSAMALRAGLNSRAKDVPGFAGVSAGAGWEWKSIRLDYAWVPFRSLDQTHRLSITYAFAATPSDPKRENFSQTPPEHKLKRAVYMITPMAPAVPRWRAM